MFARTEYYKVAGRVIPLDLVLVMDVFVSAKSPAELLFHDIAMFHDARAVLPSGFFVWSDRVGFVFVEDISTALRTERLMSKPFVLTRSDPAVAFEFEPTLSAGQDDCWLHSLRVTDFDPICKCAA